MSINHHKLNERQRGFIEGEEHMRVPLWLFWFWFFLAGVGVGLVIGGYL